MIFQSKIGGGGRLGNTMFGIASSVGLALRHKTNYAFGEWKYRQYFKYKLPFLIAFLKDPIRVKEKNYHFDDYKLCNEHDYDLMGYFQSSEYWRNFDKEIKQVFEFTDEILNAQKLKLPKNDNRNIAIHVRRGDYVGNESHYNLPIGYYLTALEKLDWQNSNIIIFSDDIEFAKWHFQTLPNAYFSEGTDIEDLCLGSLCDDFIIANSSFSWWQAYLGQKEGSRVIRPVNHFAGNQLKHDIKDLYPMNWIANGDEKPNLNDTTFIIPVCYDHEDRKTNLNHCIAHLLGNFETNICITEYSGNEFEYVSKYANYYTNDLKEFHRTKMINDVAKVCDAKFIVNHDADILINPVQIWYSVQILREGVDIVYPYDGTFNYVEKPIINQLNGSYYPLIGHTYRSASMSFGGSIFINRKSFLEAGGENENFISWGPEDAERYNRFLKLGLSVNRIKGALYHLEHYRGVNSGRANPFLEKNRAEWNKIQGFNKDTLKNYIKTWSWLNH